MVWAETAGSLPFHSLVMTADRMADPRAVPVLRVLRAVDAAATDREIGFR